MEREGYTYSYPAEPYEEQFVKTGLEAQEDIHPSEAELSMARQDLSCKKETDLVSIWRTAAWKHQSAVIDKYRPALAAEADRTEEMVRRANEVLAKR